MVRKSRKKTWVRSGTNIGKIWDSLCLICGKMIIILSCKFSFAYGRPADDMPGFSTGGWMNRKSCWVQAISIFSFPVGFFGVVLVNCFFKARRKAVQARRASRLEARACTQKLSGSRLENIDLTSFRAAARWVWNSFQCCLSDIGLSP